MSSSPESDGMEELQAGIDQSFADMDADGDGVVTKAELRAFAIAENPGVPVDDVLDLMFADLDADGDGRITKVELALVAVRQRGAKCEDC